MVTLFARNDGLDTQLQEIFINPVSPIPFVAAQRVRPSDGNGLAVLQTSIGSFKNAIQSSGIVLLAGSQMEVQRMTMTITEKVDFCRKTAARTA